MAYPALDISASGPPGFNTGREIQTATNGASRGRMFYTARKRRFPFNHPLLNSTDLATFDAFYAANLTTSFSFTWPRDGVTYTCMFSEKEPTYTPVGRCTTVSVELIEV